MLSFMFVFVSWAAYWGLVLVMSSVTANFATKDEGKNNAKP
jgi:hypothetical protein